MAYGLEKYYQHSNALPDLASQWNDVAKQTQDTTNYIVSSSRSPGAVGETPQSNSPGSWDAYNRTANQPSQISRSPRTSFGGSSAFPATLDYRRGSGYSGAAGAYRQAQDNRPTWNPQGPRPELQLQKVGALPELQLPEYAAPEADPDRVMQLKQTAMRPGMRGLEQSFQQGRLNMDYMSSPTSQKEYIRGLLGGMSEGIEKIAGQAGNQAMAQFNTERQEQIDQYDKKYGLKQRQVETNYRQAIDKILKNVDIANDQARSNWDTATQEYFTAGKSKTGASATGGFTQTEGGNYYKGKLVPPGYSEADWLSMDERDQDIARRTWEIDQQKSNARSKREEAKNQYVYTVVGTGAYGIPKYGYLPLSQFGAGR